jgi:hypothetical protein
MVELLKEFDLSISIKEKQYLELDSSMYQLELVKDNLAENGLCLESLIDYESTSIHWKDYLRGFEYKIYTEEEERQMYRNLIEKNKRGELREDLKF